METKLSEVYKVGEVSHLTRRNSNIVGFTISVATSGHKQLQIDNAQQISTLIVWVSPQDVSATMHEIERATLVDNPKSLKHTSFVSFRI